MMKSSFVIRNCGCLLIALSITNTIYAQDLSNLKNQKPFSYSGALEVRTIGYQMNGAANRRNPFSLIISGSPTLSFYGWDVPFSVVYTDRKTNFQQPFNQFGLSPTYKWITLHGGYRNLNFSPYTLGGHTMLGAGAELNPGKFRLGFMYGRLNKATVIDSVTQSLAPQAFTRKGYAVKVGYGTKKSFIDFSYLNAKDDSVGFQKSQLNRQFNPIAPSANSVVGYKGQLSFLKYFSVESEGAVSLYTRNLHTTLPIDSLEDPILKTIRKFARVNATSELYTAFSAGVGYRDKKYGLKLNYRRIDPEFKSMGAYFITSDIEAWTITPSFIAWKNKISFNGSIGIQKDNLQNQKNATNKRFIGAGNASLQFTDKLGVDASYSNYSNNQTPNTVRFADSLRIVQTTEMYSLMPRYIVSNENYTHMVTVAATLSNLNDFNQFFADSAVSRNMDTKQLMANYSIGFIKQGINLNTSVNTTKLSGMGINQTYTGFSLGGDVSLLKSLLRLSTNHSLTLGKQDIGKSIIYNSSLNTKYRLTKGHNIDFGLYFLRNSPATSGGVQQKYSELRGELAYQIKF
ncbi:hypothetical protein [Pedobacter namyangjuensis]|uniref:hypothetical protein n=1 Tax=Pedobacter namyangjuensis TaxID=600626 RepID=UPI0013B3BCF5|nr:hypothetical protein [Pedobacter namyangjuensis]